MTNPLSEELVVDEIPDGKQISLAFTMAAKLKKPQFKIRAVIMARKDQFLYFFTSHPYPSEGTLITALPILMIYYYCLLHILG